MDEMLSNLGQLFVIGYPGTEPPAPFLDFVQEEQPGGVILFGDNCPTHATARESIDLIRGLTAGVPPLIAIDQEGGRVCRLKGAPAEFKAPSDYGAREAVEHFREDYARSVVLMQSIGVNLNLAPVADIFLDPRNDCLDTRCFGTTPDIVSRFVRASVQVAKQHRSLCCLKHFPGLGAAHVDPHKAVATADYDEIVWKQRERLPFAAGVADGADLIMTTHLSLPNVSGEIVTGSRDIISNWIRRELSFDGPVITDDLLMKGAEVLGNIGERTVAAFNAGHDLLLFGQEYERAIQAFDYFADAVKRGEISSTRLRSALDRVAGMKFRLDKQKVR
ncbi:hypothetical protein GF377_07550 [candidate division GN15 bacterium]|nr:hypothetical protein [candidate division GN15 bacterium]